MELFSSPLYKDINLPDIRFQKYQQCMTFKIHLVFDVPHLKFIIFSFTFDIGLGKGSITRVTEIVREGGEGTPPFP